MQVFFCNCTFLCCLLPRYVGQTKEKVAAAMQAARGGVLFIDEAYALTCGSFGQEAVTKLLSMLTGASPCTIVLSSGCAPSL